MNRCIPLLAICSLFTVAVASARSSEIPELLLGPKPSFGFFQPRVTVEIFRDDAGLESLGPEASSFLLDTGASGILLYPPATEELAAKGFENEGTFEEIGIGGSDFFDVSAPYRLDFQGTSGVAESLQDVRALSGKCAPDPTGLMGLNGIVGMPAMDNRVTTLDNRVRTGALPLSMGVTFSGQLPTASTHRFTVPLTELAFPAEGDGPLPTFESLSTLEIISSHQGRSTTDAIVLDSGAQVTIFSSDIANAIGLDTNGNGDFLDESVATVPLTGASGQVNAPVLAVDEIRIPTDQGFELVWSDAEIVVFDIHPSITGVLGADFMTGDGGLDFSLLGGGGLGGLLGGGGGLEDLLGGLLGGGGGLETLLGGLLGGGGGGLEDLLGGLLGGGGGLGDLFGASGGLPIARADDGSGSSSESCSDPLGGLNLDDLLGGLGDLGDLGGLLGGLGGGTDLFAAFPLESYFDRVHFDFRVFPESGGQLVFDLNPGVSESILNGDHVFDVRDIDDLTEAFDTSNGHYDLNGDGIVDSADRDMLVRNVFKTVAGDADLDGDVDFGDFLALSIAFSQPDGGWANGDFDGDGETGFGDFLLLSDNFGKTITAAAIPEPSTNCLAALATLVGLALRPRRKSTTMRPSQMNRRELMNENGLLHRTAIVRGEYTGGGSNTSVIVACLE